VVFESESIDPGAMSRPPRRAGTTMFDRRVLVVTVGQGLVVLASVLVVYGLTVRWGDPAGVTRSTTFTTLVLSNLALMFVNRSWHASAWTIVRERRNPSVPWVLAITSAVTAVLLLVPVCRRAFGFGVMDAGHLALSFCGAAAGVAWFEAYKCFRRAK
jgi:Ca2+-transporting ATPase